MNEAEWVARTDLREMTKFLQFKGTARKRRLFVVACARAIWDHIPPGDMRQVVEVAECVADDPAQLTQLYNLGHVLSAYRSATATAEQMSWALGSAERRSVYFHCIMTAYELRDTSKLTECPWHETRVLTESLQPFLFRDIFGNPFRPAVVARNWRTDTVRALAQQMYESRDFSAMPILADALQDAGCDNDEVLAHCRSPAALHARGCCVVDAVLGKE